MSRLVRVAGLMGAALVMAAGIVAGTGGPAAAETPDPLVLRDFFDRRVPELMAAQKVPGLAVTVVDGSGELFTGDYGFADVAAGLPVVAEETAFRTASIAKTFTAVAVLQQVEAGALDLHADVNTYLPGDFRIADAYPGRPVTLHHLLTHTAGFADLWRGDLTTDLTDVLPLKDFLPAFQPDRVYPPGEYVSYSNYGLQLAGYIVERVSGRPFASYMDERLFGPLGMRHSGFVQPSLAAERFPVSLYYGSDPSVLMPLHHPQGGPEGSTGHASAADMGRFLRMLLGGGEYEGVRVLQPSSVDMMLARQAGSHPLLDGAGYGTWQLDRVGPGIVTSYGGDGGAHAQFALVPGRDLGIYVVANGDGSPPEYRSHIRALIVEEFLALVTDTRPDPVPVKGSVTAPPSGDYLTSRHVEGEPMKLLQLAFDRVTVTTAADGTVTTAQPAQPEHRWIPVGDGVYASTEGRDRLGFIERDGEVVGLIFESNPSQAYLLVPAHASPAVRLPIAAGALLVLSTVVVWPVVALVRRLRRRSTGERSRAALIARILAGAVAATGVAYVVFLVGVTADPTVLEFGSWAQNLPLALAVPAAAAVAVFAVVAWARRWWSRAGRVHFTAIALAAGVFLGIAAQYGLVWGL
ncbi:serine hydrolase domain-containing protein [Phytomonospora endophytica]|uniref:CubicO group peptidase (Beta-lactamase class C family) n=1 Tax=Phytomonospora endophytica TaxID=714109 RepID=A0A841FVF9_9ACTN|nr:serine hydrolase domain-containing protein [Phytomonospora endophytica]MBB6037327.1 CubicO group peptidase (beta-lactamase class C family) [Phytomonospora endophytica]GIG69929.1 FmtA-like protein [Phytomonospora endophytica]